MCIEFSASAPSTLGLEWEIALVDARTGELVQRAQEVLEAVHAAHPETGQPGLHPIVTGEFLQNTVELVTGVCRTVAEAVGQLRELLEIVRRAADPLGVEVFPAGTHPFSRWEDQPVVPKDRYDTVVDRAQYWGRQMVIFGLHVHVGVDAQAKALPVQDRLLAHYGHLLAISANSPFWNGQDTGYASHRAQLFQQLPTAGIPYSFADWSEYEQYIEDLQATGVIEQISESRLDVRPVPDYGTVEMRFCDAPTELSTIGAIAALTQCLAEETSRAVDAGGVRADGAPLEQLRPWLIKENKWRAARYGMQAILIADNALHEPLITDDLAQIVDRLRPLAQELGCVQELEHLLVIGEQGNGADRQRLAAREHDGDLQAVALDLVRRARQG